MSVAHINIYDDSLLARQLASQQRLSWDLENRLDWANGIDLSKPLLPLDEKNLLFPQATPEQRLVISQLMGLIVAASISQLERVANELKGPTWEAVMDKYPVNPELRALGEQFYEEEEKHSRAFTRYIDMFARAVNVEPDDLKSFLPQTGKSLAKKVYALNSLAGGMSMWWLIAATEEESIMVYRHLEPVKHGVDPLYYQLHRAHFEEEARHKSYALMMLSLFEEFYGKAGSLVFRKLDFILAECLNFTWTFNQLLKVKRLGKLKSHHPFFKTVDSLTVLLNGRNPFLLAHELMASTPYVSSNLRLGEYRHVREMLRRFGALRVPMPRLQERQLCLR